MPYKSNFTSSRTDRKFFQLPLRLSVQKITQKVTSLYNLTKKQLRSNLWIKANTDLDTRDQWAYGAMLRRRNKEK